MTHLFEFESDFVDSLHCIPMVVRMKLDTCGVKLKLTHWNQLNERERQYLQKKVTEKTGKPAGELAIDPKPTWKIAEKIPTEVSNKATEEAVEITQQQWARLSEIQRFALIKLSRSNHENKNFLPALKEFNLI